LQCHPFDTAKTLLQNGQTFRDMKPLSYYRGVTYPTVAALAFNVTTFPLYGYYYKKTKNAYYSGMISGIAIAPVDYVYSPDSGKYLCNAGVSGSFVQRIWGLRY
jgi:hypothetical protein